MIQEQRQWGFKVPRKSAEVIRRELIQRSNLDESLRPISNERHVIFPVKSVDNLPKSEKYHLAECMFILREIRPNFDKRLIDLLPVKLRGLRPRGFDVIGGRVAIIQLHDSLTSFSDEIANILSEIGFSSIYLRMSSVEGQYRLRHLRLLQGTPIERLIHRENGVDMVIDLKRAYFNPRLATEHERIFQMAGSDEKILDMFTGVGPFALQLAKHRSASVEAWDINPNAIACLQESIPLNQIKPDRIRAKVGDAEELAETADNESFDRVLMNLPGQSVKYIQAALPVCRKGGLIFYYRFGDTKYAGKDAIDEFNAITAQYGFEVALIGTHKVRDIAPGKSQFCCEFRRTI
ncbi:MAG: class I SAM-dependent methyltransferase family protein [Candidatus Heimdallarchaeota archaeon]